MLEWNRPISLLVATAVAPLSVFVLIPVEPLLFDKVSVARIPIGGIAACAYLSMLVSVPIFRFLQSRNLATVWTAAIVGLLSVWVVPLVVSCIALVLSRGTNLIVPLLTVSMAAPFSPIGVLVGVVFWAIARTGG